MFAFLHPSDYSAKTLAIALAVALSATGLRADHLFIVDASASMGQMIAGEPKSQIAARLMGESLKGADPNEALGLLVYGANRKGDCQDWSLLPPARDQAGAISEMLQKTRTIGKAPLGAAIGEAVGLAARGAIDRVTLITDGADSCGVDACGKLMTLPETARLTVNVVDLGAPPDERDVLVCLAEQSGGIYRRHEGAQPYAEAPSVTAPQDTSAEPEPMRPVAVRISSGTTDPVEWSAVPLDRQSVEAIAAPEAVAGAFETALEPGRWEVHGSAHAFDFHGVITVTASDQGKIFTIPATLETEGMADDGKAEGNAATGAALTEAQPEGGFAIRNDSRLTLSFRDPATGLEFVLPPSWAIDAPFRDNGGPVSVGFFATSLPDSFPNIALHPIQWTGGPCVQIAVGDLCHDTSPEALAAFDTIQQGLTVAGE